MCCVSVQVYVKYWLKGKTQKEEVDPNTVKEEARSGEKQKVSFILKLITKTKSRQTGTKGKVATKDETK